MKQFLITPAAGKRLIAKALMEHPEIKKTLRSGTLAIIAGTTNGYVAEEILKSMGQENDFSRKRFFRGIVLPPGAPVNPDGRYADDAGFPGDVIITDGVWEKGMRIFDVVDSLKEGDIILKGANALNLDLKQAAIFIGHPQAGTIGAALPGVVGRRVRLILPVGLEKRVSSDLNELAVELNQPGLKGPRLLPVPGEVFTEIEAIKFLTGAKAKLVAAGGVAGAEGSVWLAIPNNEKIEKVLNEVSTESPFSL
ncbi:MAG: hypothetical protein QM405_04925 [Euryarchaeota archaeon]|jgi:hypothetical protein|nr:hypothetical protein [Euryarchaeota archaeon]HNS24701.1 hypothetical protein [Methanobacteriaceae archaeon]